MRRYARLYKAFLKYTLMEQMSFRGNFLIHVLVELLWFGLLLLFYDIVFAHTRVIAGWSHAEYLVLLGTFYVVTGLVEAFVMPNCAELSELVRTGKLDFALTKPVDEQFILTVRKIDWPTLSNVAYGLAAVAFGLRALGWVPDVRDVLLYLTLIASGFVFFYSVMITLAVTAVHLVRNQSVYEQWFYVIMFARYPPDIFSGEWGSILRKCLTYLFPVLVVVSVPAKLLARAALDVRGAAIALFAAVVGFAASRWIFRRTLRSYRGASA